MSSYTTVTIDTKLLGTGGGEAGTVTFKCFQRLVLANGDVIPPAPLGHAVVMASDGTGTISLPATDTATVGTNATYLVTYTGVADTAERVLGPIVVPTSTTSKALSDLLAASNTGTTSTTYLPTPYCTLDAAYTFNASATALAVVGNTNAFVAGMYVVVTDGTHRTTGTLSAATSGSLTFTPLSPTPPGDSGTGTVYAAGSSVAAAGARGATGATGTAGATGTTGSTGATGPGPFTTTTGSYTQASSAIAIAVTDSTAFVVGEDAVLVNGSNKIHGTLTAKSAGSLTFQRYATIPTGDTADTTVYASGSNIAACGAQGATGTNGVATTTTTGLVSIPTAGDLSVDGAGAVSAGANIPRLNANNVFTVRQQMNGGGGIAALRLLRNASNGLYGIELGRNSVEASINVDNGSNFQQGSIAGTLSLIAAVGNVDIGTGNGSKMPIGTFAQNGNMGIQMVAPTYGLHQVGGRIRLQAEPTPNAPSGVAGGTLGATTWTAWVITRDRNGNATAISAASASVTNANATLTGVNVINWSWTNSSVAGNGATFDLLGVVGAGPATPTGTGNFAIATGLANTGSGSMSYTQTSNTLASYTVPTRNATADAIVDGGIQVGGGTLITQTVVYTPSLTPASTAANTTAEQTFTVTGLTTADKVIVNGPAPTAGTGIVGVRVSAANTLAINFANNTAGALTPAAGTYAIVAIRS